MPRAGAGTRAWPLPQAMRRRGSRTARQRQCCCAKSNPSSGPSTVSIGGQRVGLHAFHVQHGDAGQRIERVGLRPCADRWCATSGALVRGAGAIGRPMWRWPCRRAPQRAAPWSGRRRRALAGLAHRDVARCLATPRRLQREGRQGQVARSASTPWSTAKPLAVTEKVERDAARLQQRAIDRIEGQPRPADARTRIGQGL